MVCLTYSFTGLCNKLCTDAISLKQTLLLKCSWLNLKNINVLRRLIKVILYRIVENLDLCSILMKWFVTFNFFHITFEIMNKIFNKEFFFKY